MARRLKILISAYACSPFQGSEAGVGWGFVKALSHYHDLWVIVEKEKFQKEMEEGLALDPLLKSRVRCFYIAKKRRPLLRRLWPPSYYWFYRQWHKKAYRLAETLEAEIGFDLVHQLTMVGFREPGYLWKLGLPFVWGPIGGMGFFPWRFLSSVGLFGAVYYLFYNTINLLHMHYLSRPKQAAQTLNATLIAATPENQRGIKKLWNRPSTVLSEVGLPRSITQPKEKRTGTKPLKLVWSGLHSYRKALPLALKALASLPNTLDWQFHILGVGPETEAWKTLAKRLGIFPKCRFYGWISREEVLSVMEKSHVMIITSLRDLTSSVTIEALSMGLPVIAPDHSGFSHVITPQCGMLIPMHTPTQYIQQLADAVQWFYVHETERFSMAIEASKRAEHFNWKKKAAIVENLYQNALISTNPKQTVIPHENSPGS